MGNSIITKRIKGITQYYAKDHISELHRGDFLRIIPEFDNPYDHHALAIYDDHGHKLGFVDKNSNVAVYRQIKGNDYVCVITQVFYDYDYPGIEYNIIYRNNGTREDISERLFSELLRRYSGSEGNESAIEDKKDKTDDDGEEKDAGTGEELNVFGQYDSIIKLFQESVENEVINNFFSNRLTGLEMNPPVYFGAVAGLFYQRVLVELMLIDNDSLSSSDAFLLSAFTDKANLAVFLGEDSWSKIAYKSSNEIRDMLNEYDQSLIPMFSEIAALSTLIIPFWEMRFKLIMMGLPLLLLHLGSDDPNMEKMKEFTDFIEEDVWASVNDFKDEITRVLNDSQ